MREIVKLFYMFFLVFSLLAIPVSAQPATTVSVGDASVMSGDSVTMPIMVNYVTNLGSGTIDVSYNASIVHVTAVTDGTGNALKVQDWNADNNIGIVRIVAWNASIPHSGDVIFANVTYKAVGYEGSSTTLNITVGDLTDYYNCTQINHTITNGTFTVTHTTTPTPLTGGGRGGGGGSVRTTSTPTPKPTEKPPAILGEETPSPTLAPTITPATTPAQPPAPTLPARVPVISWSIILVAIFISVIIILTGYLLMRKRS
jgi:hypothetical protein